MIPRSCSTCRVLAALILLSATGHATDPNLSSLQQIASISEQRVVKLYGAGGFAGLEAYQSGSFISEEGHILTAWSTVLDVEQVLAVTSDGQRYEAELVGIDPNLEIAILKTDAVVPAHFEIRPDSSVTVGTRILALSNLFGIAAGREMASVQRGIIMARTELNASRGNFKSVYQGPVWILDATTNNPGAAGGALTDLRGNLVGMLGKELRDESTGIWLSYAIPIKQLSSSIEKIIAGQSITDSAVTRRPSDRPLSLQKLGIALVPDVLEKTPAFVDTIQPQSPADRAGLRADDLILFLNSIRIDSQAKLHDELRFLDQTEQTTMLLQRDTELTEVILSP